MFPTKRRGLSYTKIAPAVIISNRRLAWVELLNFFQGVLVGVALGSALILYLFNQGAFDGYFK